MKKIVLLFLLFTYSLADNLKEIYQKCADDDKKSCKLLNQELIKLDSKCNDDKNATACIMAKLAIGKFTLSNIDDFFVHTYYQKMCDLDFEDSYSSMACDEIGTRYLIKAQEKKDKIFKKYFEIIAKKYFEKSCKKKNEKDCYMPKYIKE